MEEAVNPAAPAEPAGFPFPQPRTWVRRNERKTERNIRKGVISRRRHPFRGRAARAMSGCCDDSAAGSEDFEGHEKVAPATGPLPACARALSRTDAKPPQPDSPAPAWAAMRRAAQRPGGPALIDDHQGLAQDTQQPRYRGCEEPVKAHQYAKHAAKGFGNPRRRADRTKRLENGLELPYLAALLETIIVRAKSHMRDRRITLGMHLLYEAEA